MGAFMALSIRLTIRIDAQQLIRVTLSCAIQKPCWGKCWGTEPCYDNNSNDYNAMRRGTGGEGVPPKERSLTFVVVRTSSIFQRR